MEKVILITGASGGMGSFLAEHFSKEGYNLALHYRNNPVKLEPTDRIQHFNADLTNSEEVKKLIADVLEAFGKIDVIINNAGISRNGMSWKLDETDWRETLSVNLDAPFFVSKAAIPSMREQKFGRIINISSVVAQTGFIGTAAYAASKAGLIGLTKSMAKELINKEITVNALALGYYNVGMINDVPDELRKKVIDTIPAGKLGDPITVFETIKWLISDEAGYVTGQTINLNGGMY